MKLLILLFSVFSAANLHAADLNFTCKIKSYPDGAQEAYIQKFDANFNEACDRRQEPIQVEKTPNDDKYQIDLLCGPGEGPLKYQLDFMSISKDGHSAVTIAATGFQELGLALYLVTPNSRSFEIDCAPTK